MLGVAFDKLEASGVLLRLFVLVESFTHGGRFTVVNHEYRDELSDKTSDDYKRLAALVESGVSIN